MKTRLKILMAVLAALFCACAPATPEVRVILADDDSLPCLGAKHIKFVVDLQEGNYVFDEFADQGVFFDLNTNRCAFNAEFHYDRLALSPAARVDISVQDSTTGPAQEHILALGSTVTFAVNENSPTQEWIITLSRKAETRLGTAYCEMPNDWNTIKQGIHFMEFAVYEDTEQGPITARSHQLAYDRSTFPEPWPIIISNLPVEQNGKQYRVRVVGLDGERKPVRTWLGDVFLQAYTLGWVNWPPGP